MRLLVTRPAREAEGTAHALRDKGHEVLVSPVLEIVSTGAALPNGPFAALLATSAQAFEMLTEEQAAALRTLPLHVVGARTAAAAAARGWPPPVALAPDGARLAASLREAGLASRSVLYLTGRQRKSALEEACAKLACRLQVVEIYEACPARHLTPEVRAALADGRVDAVLHFSNRSAVAAVQLATRDGVMGGFARARHLCLSEDVAQPLHAQGLATVVAAAPNMGSLFEALESG